MKNIRHSGFIPLLFIVALLPLSCAESLPPYEDPLNVLKGDAWSAYVITNVDNSIKIFLTVVNTYDETFEGIAILRGEATITWGGDPAAVKRFNLDASHLISARGYNPATRMLTFDPGDSIRIGVSWNFITDAGLNVREAILYHRDPLCYPRFISHPETFHLTAEILVYDRTGKVIGSPRSFTFQITKEYVDPRSC